jgi:hypothetical protein
MNRTSKQRPTAVLSATRLALAVLLFSAAPTLAAPINPSRPLPLSVGSEPSLQDLFDTLTPLPGAIDAFNDQSGIALFSPSGPSAATTLLFEVAGHRNINEFGIYSATDPEIRATIFAGPDSPDLQQAITFNGDGSVDIDGVSTDGFGDGFGFYLRNTQTGDLFFSEDDLNEGMTPHALVYRGDGLTLLELPGTEPSLFEMTQFLVAFEDLRFGGDTDYQDLVVHVNNLQPLVQAPEPASALLLGCGILFLGARRILRA